MSFEAGLRAERAREFASLQGCFVEGSRDERARERRIRRRALLISIAAQSATLTLVILIPLFGKPERMALAGGFVPLPRYHHRPRAEQRADLTPRGDRRRPCFTCPDSALAVRPVRNPAETDEPIPPDPFAGPDGQNSSKAWSLLGADSRPQPPQPEFHPQTAKRILLTHLEPAMLVHRVAPVYPTLAKHTHREGRVELRAIIATDGSIQSLQVVSGEALFLPSAIDAVSQWRYRPTVLNGQPVEVDTFITVVYTMEH